MAPASGESVVPRRTKTLIVERIGKVLNDRIGEKFFAHFAELCFDGIPGVVVIQRDPKQFSDANIFHAAETEGMERVFDGFPLGIEDR